MKIAKSLMAVSCAVAILLLSCMPGTDTRAESTKVIKVTAKRYEYNPDRITLKKGVPVTIEFTSLDRLHGFNCPDLGIRADIFPGKVSRVTFTPQKTGKFPFHCDNFCGEGHDHMTGEFEVTE